MLAAAQLLRHVVAVLLGDGGAQALLEAARLDERPVLAAQLVEQRVDWVFRFPCLAQQLEQLRVLGRLLHAPVKGLERPGLEPARVDAELPERAERVEHRGKVGRVSRIDSTGQASTAVPQRQEGQCAQPLVLLHLLLADAHPLSEQLHQLVVELGGQLPAVGWLQAPRVVRHLERRALSRDGLGALEAKLRAGQSPEEQCALVDDLLLPL